jgi:hypothetical protein
MLNGSILPERGDRIDPSGAQRRNQRCTCAHRDDAEQACGVGDWIEQTHDRSDQLCRRRRQERGAERSRGERPCRARSFRPQRLDRIDTGGAACGQVTAHRGGQEHDRSCGANGHRIGRLQVVEEAGLRSAGMPRSLSVARRIVRKRTPSSRERRPLSACRLCAKAPILEGLRHLSNLRSAS